MIMIVLNGVLMNSTYNCWSICW